MPSISVRLRAYTLPLVPAVLASFAVALHVAPAARANASQISIMMDDDQVVYAPDTQRITVLERMKSLGVDLVRATALRSVVAQGTPKGSTSWNAVTQPFGLANACGFVGAVVPAGPYSGRGTFRAVWSGPVPPDTLSSRSVPYP